MLSWMMLSGEEVSAGWMGCGEKASFYCRQLVGIQHAFQKNHTGCRMQKFCKSVSVWFNDAEPMHILLASQRTVKGKSCDEQLFHSEVFPCVTMASVLKTTSVFS